MERLLAVVLASGGMDSCVTVAIAAQSHRLALLHLTYGQRTMRREVKAFHDVADYYRAAHRLVVPLEHLSVIGGSSLTDSRIPVSVGRPEGSEIPSTYVPFRNATMLSVAVSWAEVLAASAVFIGAVEEDSSGYPDCRREFYDAFGRVVELGTKPTTHIRIETPVIGLTKAQIVRKGVELGAPMQLTWSCYQNEDVACGVCDSCMLRQRGFRLAGITDPIPYRI